MADAEQPQLTTLTVDLLSAYLANNNVQHGDLPELIKSTHAALKAIDAPEPPAPVEPEHKPAVGVRKSLSSRTHIISMIDGKPYQTLKRHLSKHGLTPEQYRERYSLPRDYPMVAAAYSDSRRAIAERLGLGRKVKGAQAAATTPEPATETPPAKSATNATKAQAAKPARKAKPARAASAPAAVEPAKQPAKRRAADKPAGDAAPTAEKAPAAKPAPRKRATRPAPAAEPTS